MRTRAVKDDSATRLRIAMASVNMNTQELAWAASVSERTVSALRNGNGRRPQYETMHRIADALGVSINDIWVDA